VKKGWFSFEKQEVVDERSCKIQEFEKIVVE